MGFVTDLFKLDEKVAVVTGGAKGIGVFYSEALANVGSKVVIADIDPKAVMEATARLSEEYPGQILGVDLDVTKQSSIEEMIERIDEKWGRLDILVNNAGIFANLPQHSSPWDIPDDEFDDVMTVNIRGVYACTKFSVPLMSQNGWGRLINIASGLGLKGSPQIPHYAATKAAVINLTRSMAPLMAKHGITVNAIAPGGTDGPTVIEARMARAAASPDAILSQRGSQGARTRPGGPTGATRVIDRTEVPEDLIGTLIYLASPASEFITGQTIVVDGGMYFN